MLKRNLALASLAIALIANITALAGNKQDLSNMKVDKVKANVMAELKAVTINQHPGPHIAKSQERWKNSGTPHAHPGDGHIHLNSPPNVKSSKMEAKNQSSMKLSAEKAEKKESSFKSDKSTESC